MNLMTASNIEEDLDNSILKESSFNFEGFNGIWADLWN
jgi:hypothetical protein